MSQEKLEFWKYSATGNDFILLDARGTRPDELLLSQTLVQNICDRRHGVGADGVIQLADPPAKSIHHFSMIYYNSDGNEASMCGNGTRAITHFAHSILKIPAALYSFKTKHGSYTSSLSGHSENVVQVSMSEVGEEKSYDYLLLTHPLLQEFCSARFLNTGVPHLVLEMTSHDLLQRYDIEENGRKIRSLPEFGPEGANVNVLAELESQRIYVRTYERGVEAETLSCGTGVLASVLTFAKRKQLSSPVQVCTRGGELQVFFDWQKREFLLAGPVHLVFKGEFYV